MVVENLEMFLLKAKSKLHVMEILPYYSLRCCIVTQGERSFFSLSKNQMQLVQDATVADIVIEGTKEEILELLNGTKMRDVKGLAFKGSFRHFLLMDSLFTLVNRSERKEVS
ncbi:hypothetical protein ACQCU1_03155 [Sutcliffiella horikoshii]|uniref:Uncharacterized protein n=1 Tax=Sutcliffiella horikoshii TaxID=79883 RepID=A0A1Y0CSM3_9BACI|nr:hypothetical protein [Sutcliffiella horikoshii]ART77907.1 hypothetical protein B4U37_18540 [Sutcliffiella horikoshii]TYS60154.1 hypothetical protein FZC74_08395 [Sutcliffiella horikoshii]